MVSCCCRKTRACCFIQPYVCEKFLVDTQRQAPFIFTMHPSIVCTHHRLFIHVPVEGRLGYLLFFTLLPVVLLWTFFSMSASAHVLQLLKDGTAGSKGTDIFKRY